ncbi:bifunctional DNA primase/polymerase [Nocardia sp. KC 131]|uniref:bifunctional DNA primase/polymerase n=1 Tax=Nocardia arseniciresistens TaxID=3392119 RepID=UPI00398E929A
MHLYYRAPRKRLLRNTIGRLGWRIDSRGSGGYIVAAQSELPHGSYRVADEHAPIPLADTDVGSTAVTTVPAAVHPDQSSRCLRRGGVVESKCSGPRRTGRHPAPRGAVGRQQPRPSRRCAASRYDLPTSGSTRRSSGRNRR